MIFLLAILGAIVVFLAAVIGCALLLASMLPEEPRVRQREPELIPLVPAVTRKQHPDIWVN